MRSEIPAHPAAYVYVLNKIDLQLTRAMRYRHLLVITTQTNRWQVRSLHFPLSLVIVIGVISRSFFLLLSIPIGDDCSPCVICLRMLEFRWDLDAGSDLYPGGNGGCDVCTRCDKRVINTSCHLLRNYRFSSCDRRCCSLHGYCKYIGAWRQIRSTFVVVVFSCFQFGDDISRQDCECVWLVWGVTSFEWHDNKWWGIRVEIYNENFTTHCSKRYEN